MTKITLFVAALMAAVAAGCGGYEDEAGTRELPAVSAPEGVEVAQQKLVAPSCQDAVGSPRFGFVQIVDGAGYCWEVNCNDVNAPQYWHQELDLRQRTIPNTSWNWNDRAWYAYRRNDMSLRLYQNLNLGANLYWATGVYAGGQQPVEQIALPQNVLSSLQCRWE